MTLRELQAELEKKRAASLALLDAADAEGRDLTADEDARYSALDSEIEDLTAKIATAKKTAERRTKLGALSTSAPALDRTTNEPDPAATGGFASIAEFAVAVRQASANGGVVDPRLRGAAPSAPHVGGGDGGEGYMLPPQYRDEIWELVAAQDNLLEAVDLEPTANREIKMAADETTPWGTTGVQAYWRSEASKMQESKLDTQPRSLSLHEVYAFVTASEELREDAPRLEARLTRKSAQAISYKIDEAIVHGSGAGQPLGWMNAPAMISVAKEGSQAADTILAENVLKMRSRFMRVPGDRPFWLANSDTLPQLATMTIGDQPMYVSNMRDAPDGVLLGFPIRFSEHAPTVGDAGDLQLISPLGYYAARRTAGVQFAQSMHLFFDYNTEAYRWTFRFGGQPHLARPVTPPRSANTKSHFVRIAARA